MHNLQTGDVVHDPDRRTMTVVARFRDGTLKCVWHDEGEHREEVFPASKLRKVSL